MNSSTTPSETDAPPYRHVAPVYDLLASAYSLGAIDEAKTFHHSMLHPNDRVLYVGAGRGKEIIEACRRGAEVTCVEPCGAMATRLHQRLSEVADGFTIIPKPIQSIAAEPLYDLVVAHFFLNVFDAGKMPQVLTHLCRFVKPGGRLVIADFKPNDQTSNLATRWLRTAYYRPVNLAGWLLRICALHPIYDYEPILAKYGMTVTARHSFHCINMLLACYETIMAESSAAGSRPRLTC